MSSAQSPESISLVVPIYNEEASIPALLDRTLAVCERHSDELVEERVVERDLRTAEEQDEGDTQDERHDDDPDAPLRVARCCQRARDECDSWKASG